MLYPLSYEGGIADERPWRPPLQSYEAPFLKVVDDNH